MKSLIQKIDECNFQCEAGPLSLSDDWKNLKEKIDLFVIHKRGSLVRHTLGKGGWGFNTFTNKDEAQAMADAWNRKNYAGNKICTVMPLLPEPPTT